MRNLTKTLAIVSLLTPATAQPLGIGEIKLHSALNQKLNAEIKLMLSPGENPANIRVQMAPPTKFDEAGIPWSYYLSKIKMDKVVNPNGSVTVKLSTHEVFSEPFLDFLLEVSWENGNLYREFTVLVDPPAAYEESIVPVVVAASETKKSVNSTPSVESATTSSSSASVYGPVSKTDTLWKIADKVKPSSEITNEQMMMAILEANPHAFHKRNVNFLKSGVELQIPDKESVLKLSRRQAASLFAEHNEKWRQMTVAKKTAEKIEKPKHKLDLVAPVETSVGENEVVKPGQEKIDIKGPELAKTIEKTVNDSTVALDTNAPVQNQALNDRLQKLEQQIAMMQKLLVLKDEQLAALQNQPSVQATQPDLAETESATENTPASQQQLAKEDVSASEQIEPAIKQQSAKPVEKPEASPLSKKLRPVPQPESEPSFFAENLYGILGGSIFLLASVIGLVWWRRNQKDELTDTESMFAASSEITMPDSEVAETSMEQSEAYDVGTVGESSFLSEFTPSDFDAFETEQNEVDPIQEADVYLAYGRYQQAEELIKQAIADHPERDDSKLKLLEIYYASENTEQFISFVNQLKSEGKEQDANFWVKVEEMGKEILPSEQAGTLTAPVDQAEQATIDINQQQDSVVSTNGFATELEDELDFDLDTFKLSDNEEQSTVEKAISLEESKQDEGLEFNFSEDKEEKTEELLAESSIESEEIEALDFDFNTEESNEADDFDLDLNSETGDEIKDIVAGEEDDVQEETEATLDELASNIQEEDSFDFSFDESLLEGAGSSEEQNSLSKDGVADLTDMDEFETKLDLAKAYIDMGDEGAAKLIVEEVLENGNEQQQETAKTLLEELH